MGNVALGLLHGMVIETSAESWTGEYLYSDFATGQGEKNTLLNTCTRIPFLGILAGLTRVALGIIHSIGHLCAAVYTQKKGHLFHAAKGASEILRGLIEAIPLIGRIFANVYNARPIYDPDGLGGRSWWMIKIYNPNQPDGLDDWMDNWQDFPQAFYVKA
jgi:hypothetical protein